jgi:hypothetical protein
VSETDRPEPIDNLWYILLTDRERLGGVWALGKGSRGRTRDLALATSFDSERKAQNYLAKRHVPDGHLATIHQIARYPARPRPKRTKLVTPYGTITLLDGQTTFLSPAPPRCPVG